MTAIGTVPKTSIRTDISELDKAQVAVLLADWTYASLFPIKCEACGSTSEFSRRIFKVTGLDVPQYSDNSTQNVLRNHFLKKHEIEYIFFRTLSDSLYVDSAICPECKSTRVVYDISIRSTLWAAAGYIRNWIKSLTRPKAGG